MLIPTIFRDFIECVPRKGVLHIGAHECEELGLYYSIGLRDDRILWIEAIPDLVEKMKKNNSCTNIIQAVITDNDNEEVNFMITNNIQSSSIFNLKTHLQEHPHVFEQERIKLQTTTLNTLYDKNKLSYDTYDFINLDIQGAELKALQGATKILPHIRAIYCEVNEKELYEGCALLPDLDDFLKQYNFQRIATCMTPHGWGDALYIKQI